MAQKILVYEVMVPEHKKQIFEEMMNGKPRMLSHQCTLCPYSKGNFIYRDTGFFRIADLDAWLNNSQEPISKF